MRNRSMFVGLDVHKDTIDVSIAEGERDGEVRHYGVIASDLEPLDKVVRALRAPHRTLHFVYEAGPCGFGIYRHLTKRGEHCVVVSPSMIPKRSGDRVKTDRRDSQMLARLHRAGELRAIYVPDDTDEAMRDLVRARADAVTVSIQAKYRLKAFLLRQGRRYPGRDGWTLAYRRWLTDLRFPRPPQHIALHEYRDTIDETERRLERLTEQLRNANGPAEAGHDVPSKEKGRPDSSKRPFVPFVIRFSFNSPSARLPLSACRRLRCPPSRRRRPWLRR